MKPAIETSCWTAASQELAERAAGAPWLGDFYVAGSAAVTAYLGHRQVRDLDWMSPTNRLRSASRRDLLAALVGFDDRIRVETARDGFLHVRFGEDVAWRFYYYPYPDSAPREEVAGIPLASAVDLALMKLGAIISRGARRDFVDLFLLCRHLDLGELLERSPAKLAHVRDFPLQALKGLADTSAAAGDPMPELLTAVEWSDIESWLGGEVRNLARRYVGLEGE